MFREHKFLRRRALPTGCAILALGAATQAQATELIQGQSLVVSTTSYQDVGAVAGIVAGQTILTAGGSPAVSNGNINTVFNNATVDGSFGVTSAITILDQNVTTKPGAINASETLNPSIVSTSFSSKSELGLNIAQTASGPVVTFMGYAGGGLGNLDVSNSDTTAYKDTTNPVTATYAPGAGQTYAFNRSVVALSANGSYTTTQTLAYGGNNGRSAVLAPNGNYYTVGNSNNGTGTPSALTSSTGLEVVTPGSTPNSQMVDPTLAYKFGAKADKAGKDSNFRGLTLYNGNLYFTKGSGSNGIDTVYTVSDPNGALPTSATASQATVTALPGFPTDSAKATGGDYTPFGLFFANSATLYVADEGSGNSTDTSLNAGLEKWSLVDGVWSLDYTLQSNLIGDSYNVAGWNYTETTVGLRNLAGRVNADGTVTLWATTSTTSGSGDNGADPNQVVQINDVLSALALPSSENFSVLDQASLGLRYGGVAYAVPEPSTWALMLLGFGGLGFAGYGRTKRDGAIAQA